MILRKRQKQFVERSLAALREYKNSLGVSPTGCHAKGTPILMFNGEIKNVEDIEVGEQLMGPDSRPRNVLELHRGQDEMFEIRPIKGESFVVNTGHILSLVKTNERSRDSGRASPKSLGGCIANISVHEYLNQSANYKNLHKLYRANVDFPEKDVPLLEPYFLGVLLGDGSLAHGQPGVTTADIEIAGYCQKMADEMGLKLCINRLPGNEANRYYFSDPELQGGDRLIQQLKALGVYGGKSENKIIPFNYKTGSKRVREAILAGLLDTDGYLAGGCIEFRSASKQLADDVAFVARSLGFMAIAKAKKVQGKNDYRFSICGDFSEIPLLIERKTPEPRKQKKDPLRTGFTVHSVGVGNYYGFTVDNDHLYCMGDFTVTHNSGKTIMLSAVTQEWIKGTDKKACVLAHRDELIEQNRQKFERYCHQEISTSLVNAVEKSWEGQVTFAMVPSLSRDQHLQKMPPLDLLVIDEAHHAPAMTYRKIIDQAKSVNPDVSVYGLTATAMRSDSKVLRRVFSNVADQITIGEVIAEGHLVPPKTFIVDLGVQEDLKKVKKTAKDFDMTAVSNIMNHKVLNGSVVEHWQEKAGDRKTVVFASTVQHARDVCQAFVEAGVNAAVIDGEMPRSERQTTLYQFDQEDLQVLVNCFVLTEGFDSQPVGCVVLLRPSSQKSTFIQCVGRGLRTVDPNLYPGVIKNDCIVLDFGTSSLIHGSLEQEIDLDRNPKSNDKKICPECDAEVPRSTKECPLCGYEWNGSMDNDHSNTTLLKNFLMTEIDLLQRSSFLWCDIFDDHATLMATGFDAWAGLFFWEGQWYALGGGKQRPATLLSRGERTLCLAAADDWLNEHETENAARKSRKWLQQTATAQQLKYLPAHYHNDFGLSRYHASCLLAFNFNKKSIHSSIFRAAKHQEAA